MKAVSLWQPYASLIACGAKPFETRDWAPPRELIGQPIAIHAAKKVDTGVVDFVEELVYGQHEPGGHELADRLAASWKGAPDELMACFGQAVMPVGCVVAIAKLSGAFKLGENGEVIERMISRPMPECFRPKHDDFGDYAPGRWAWLLEEVKPLTPPVPARGAQGFWEWPH